MLPINQELKKIREDVNRIDKNECKKKNVMDDKMYEDSVKLYGLKKFLQEFSRIDTKSIVQQVITNATSKKNRK